MNVSGVTRNNPIGYENNRSQRAASENSFAKEIASTAQANGAGATAVLHGSDEETGDVAVSSWADMVDGSSTTVYKTKDFDPENPIYKVKTWDAAGNVTERMVDASKIDPENCDTTELYVYTSHLKESGKGDFKETVLKTAIAKAVKYAEQKSSGSWNYSEKVNWVDAVKELMQSAYGYGDLKGYMEWKKFLGFLKQ